jgi:hypothetical protein
VYEVRVKAPAAVDFTARLRSAGIECHAGEDEVLRVFIPEPGGPREIFALAAADGVQVRHLRHSAPTLEDVFAHAVGED